MAGSTNPFRYFDSSPDVIRLVVMMYLRSLLSLRNVEDLLFERGSDMLPNGAAVVDPVWADVRCGDPAAAGRPHAGFDALAMTPRRRLGVDQQRDALSLPGG